MSEENVIDFSLHLRRKQDSILDDADRRAGTWSPRATVAVLTDITYQELLAFRALCETVAGFLSIEIEPDSDDAECIVVIVKSLIMNDQLCRSLLAECSRTVMIREMETGRAERLGAIL